MDYQGSVVVSGMYQGDPFGAFLLQSKRVRDRVLMTRPKDEGFGVNIVPKKENFPEIEAQLLNGGLSSITRNCYTCLSGFPGGPGYDERHYIIACNGRFAEGAESKMRRGGNIVDAAHDALDISPNIGGPRLIAVVFEYDGRQQHFFGAFGQGQLTPGITRTEIDEGTARFISEASPRKLGEINLTDVPPEQVAEYLYKTRVRLQSFQLDSAYSY